MPEPCPHLCCAVEPWDAVHAHDEAADDCPDCDEMLAAALTVDEFEAKYAHYRPGGDDGSEE